QHANSCGGTSKCSTPTATIGPPERSPRKKIVSAGHTSCVARIATAGYGTAIYRRRNSAHSMSASSVRHQLNRTFLTTRIDPETTGVSHEWFVRDQAL